MQYVFLIRSSAGGKKYVLHGPETVSIFIANLLAIFNDILRKNIGLSLLRSAALTVSHVRAFLNLVRSMRSTTFNAFTF